MLCWALSAAAVGREGGREGRIWHPAMAEGDKDRVPVAREGGSGFFSSSAAAALRLWPRGRVAAWRAAVGPGVHLICPATGCLLYDSQLSLSALSALCRRPSLYC